MHPVLPFMDYLFYSLHIYINQPWKLLFWLNSSFFYQSTKNDRTRTRTRTLRLNSSSNVRIRCMPIHFRQPRSINIDIYSNTKIDDIYTCHAQVHLCKELFHRTLIIFSIFSFVIYIIYWFIYFLLFASIN
jgi:hypothetical protein